MATGGGLFGNMGGGGGVLGSLGSLISNNPGILSALTSLVGSSGGGGGGGNILSMLGSMMGGGNANLLNSLSKMMSSMNTGAPANGGAAGFGGNPQAGNFNPGFGQQQAPGGWGGQPSGPANQAPPNFNMDELMAKLNSMVSQMSAKMSDVPPADKADAVDVEGETVAASAEPQSGPTAGPAASEDAAAAGEAAFDAASMGPILSMLSSMLGNMGGPSGQAGAAGGTQPPPPPGQASYGQAAGGASGYAPPNGGYYSPPPPPPGTERNGGRRTYQPPAGGYPRGGNFRQGQNQAAYGNSHSNRQSYQQPYQAEAADPYLLRACEHCNNPNCHRRKHLPSFEEVQMLAEDWRRY